MPRASRQKTLNSLNDISLSKLHRILRPLRAKSLALARVLEQPSARNHIALLKHGGSHRQAGYTSSPTANSSASASESDDDSADYRYGESHSQTRLVKHSDGSRHPLWWGHSVSDKETAVIEAFRTILFVVRPVPRQLSLPRSHPRSFRHLRSLAEQCACVLGTNIESSVADAFTKDNCIHIPSFGVFDVEGQSISSFLSDEVEGDESAVLVDLCYENIPQHLRSPAVIPHAIQMVGQLMPLSFSKVFNEIIQICAQHSLRDEARQALEHVVKRVLYASASWNQHLLESGDDKDALIKLMENGRHDEIGSSSCVSLWTEAEFVRIIQKTVYDHDSIPSPDPSPSTSWKCVPWLARGFYRLFHTLTSPAAKQLLCEIVINGCLRLVPPIPATSQGEGGEPAHSLTGSQKGSAMAEKEFLSMLCAQFDRLPRWCTALIKMDLSLPSDADMDEDDRFPAVRHWVAGLVRITVSMLTLCKLLPPAEKALRPSALSLALHALIRSSANDFSAKEVLVALTSGGVPLSRPSARDDVDTFYPLFSAFHSDPSYFHSAMMEYHDFLMELQSRSDTSAFALVRVIFLRSAVSFVRTRAEGYGNDGFFIYDEDYARLKDMLDRAEAAAEQFAHVSTRKPNLVALPPKAPFVRTLNARGSNGGGNLTVTQTNRKPKLEVYVEIPLPTPPCRTRKRNDSLPSSPGFHPKRRRADNIGTCVSPKKAPRQSGRNNRPHRKEAARSPLQLKDISRYKHLHRAQHSPGYRTHSQIATLTPRTFTKGIPGLPFPPPVLTSILLSHIPNASLSPSSTEPGPEQRSNYSSHPTPGPRSKRGPSKVLAPKLASGLKRDAASNRVSKNANVKSGSHIETQRRQRHRSRPLTPSPDSREAPEQGIVISSRGPRPAQESNRSFSQLDPQGSRRISRHPARKGDKFIAPHPSSEHDPLDLFRTHETAFKPRSRHPISAVGNRRTRSSGNTTRTSLRG
ncbi:uncharacterized protein EI90DRAFT_630291 [Cantharellus anzutake]|uniref:uncharacterized protein n=1 Tax=Cantharellus anzutake TaxID=1750568 RepID=UPI0019043752|nr:uncharacterized protein EI90DRAFT_630291 [Cantharellus anzutake]KAF8333111.1 hypothetical protein EI90DRAFT_630291 [Cantharellus anzutake]